MKLKNCYVITDAKGKQKGFIVKAISGSVNADGSYEDLHNSKQIFDTPKAVETNILATINLARLVIGYEVKISRKNLEILSDKQMRIYDLTASQVFAKAKKPIALPNPNKK